MLRKKEFDFSKDSPLKQFLFLQCKEQYEKVLAEAGQLDDEELEWVTAAGHNLEVKTCPHHGLSCEGCDSYLGINSDHSVICLSGYHKAGG